MSNYLSLGINHNGHYSPGVYAGEGYGASRMTQSLHGMINTAIEMHMQAIMLQLIAQVLQNIFQPPAEQESAQGQEEKTNTQQESPTAQSCHCAC
ncbi:MAG: hypothetical protein ACPGSM_05810 [Thiolinea sp.]